ncbi:MAG: preprotein translocase subunit SecE [Ruminococcus sp.]|jgi:preprotein translocase, SecE subunit, bacterial|nr:preprotein translocase subunit SecE [Ruminococcus sp.]MBQ9869116.1 preprotein translocase subunit SecE [Ruminococcus sp.]MCR5480413.1 preprotein translocase subunit SecE [Ruminococcus sp.]
MAKNDVTKSAKEKDKAKKAVAVKDVKKKGGLKRYFKELKSEMKKVVWPTRKKVINNTGIVMGVMAFMGLFLFAVDSGLGYAIKAILKIGT